MIAVGKLNRQVTLQEPTTALDGMGGPVLTWATYATVWSAIENEEYTSNESNAAPHERGVMSRTYIIRNHPTYNIHLKMRINDPLDGFLGAISAIRYDAKRTVCYIDAQSGASNG